MIELSWPAPARFSAARPILRQRFGRAAALAQAGSSTRASSGSFDSAPYSSASTVIGVNLKAMRPSRRCRVHRSN